MSVRHPRLALALAVGFIPTIAWAQPQAHPMPGMQAASAELTQCLRVQPAIENVISAAMQRAEAARLSNSPSELRAALDHLEAALRDIRAQSAPCVTAGASADPHAGHMMPSAQAPTGSPPAQSPAGATDPHVGHAMPSGAAPAKRPASVKPAPSAPVKPASDAHAGHAAPATKNAPTSPAAKPETSKTADQHAAHAGHSAAPSGDNQMDPVNGLMVDPASAPKTTYQGQTYYFSSEQSRKEFLENPPKFAKKPKR